ALVVMMVICCIAGYAQTFRGAVNGTVTDPSGALVPNARVTATNNGTGIAQATVTTSEGQFSFQDLPLGSYKISVTAGGIQHTTIDRVAGTAGQVYTLTVRLSMGQQATTVEVNSAALAIDTTTSTQSMTIPSTVVQDIPLNGRHFTQLITTVP